MVGIGGGSPSQTDLYLGDVVVGTRVIQYDIGKVTVSALFQLTVDAKTPAWLLNSAVSALRSNHKVHGSNGPGLCNGGRYRAYKKVRQTSLGRSAEYKLKVATRTPKRGKERREKKL